MGQGEKKSKAEHVETNQYENLKNMLGVISWLIEMQLLDSERGSLVPGDWLIGNDNYDLKVIVEYKYIDTLLLKKREEILHWEALVPLSEQKF